MEPLAIVSGVLLGFRFNVIAAGIAAGLAAGLWVGFGEKVPTRVAALLVLFFGWLIGDGWAMFSTAAEIASRPSNVYEWIGTALWAVVSFAWGYALPLWVGTFVGARVKKGTGWLAASFVAAVTPIVLGLISGSLRVGG